MKKLVFITLAAFALFSCNKEEANVQNEAQPQPFKYVFNVADKPSFDADTKAVKTSWEEGDKIYIVYDDVTPTELKDFTILEYDKSGEWTVAQVSKTEPKDEGGTIDAFYYGNPTPKKLAFDSGWNAFFFDTVSETGKYMYFVKNNISYSKEGDTVKASISLEFDNYNDETYVQFCITGLDGEWLSDVKDSQHTNNLFGWNSPVWKENGFCYIDLTAAYHIGDFRLDNRGDEGHYLYFSVNQGADAITITLIKPDGDYQGRYYKTFNKKISGKSAAITFKGPQFDESGAITNGWNKVISLKDPTIKQLCLDAGWDTDKDGALSIDEAAAVTDLGEVFKGNTAITSFNELQYFSGLSSIAKEAFMNCSSLTSVILPITVTEISEGAFYKSGLTSIVIPAAVNDIKLNPFQGCPIESITVDSNNEKYDSRDGCNAIIESESNSLFVGCKNTVIPESVTTINNAAFSLCEGLSSITIPNSVKTINNSAFTRSGLTTVTIGTGIKSIGSLAFSSESLKTVIIKATDPPSIRDNTFRDGIDVFVPAASVDDYKEKWSQLADKIKAIPSTT